MKRIVERYITMKPKLQAGKDLKAIIDKLCYIREEDFNLQYDAYLVNYKKFLKEQTYSDGKWIYTHQRLRSAVASINRYRPFLFVYQKNRWMKSTNNSVEGTNSGLKGFIIIHNGLRPDRKLKLTHYYIKREGKIRVGNSKVATQFGYYPDNSQDND